MTSKTKKKPTRPHRLTQGSPPLPLRRDKHAGMSRTTIRTPQAPAAIGPYSQAVVVPIGAGRKMIFCSGQIPIDPANGSMVGGDIAVQTRRALDNLGAVLAAAGA